jgi:BirA family biotin operon repressor/biotin-[acetyl-CoA-carboxylase] ligase
VAVRPGAAGGGAAGGGAAVRSGAIGIKWPNDLLIGDRKLAGILAEADAGAVVVGIGINVGWAPPGAVCLGLTSDDGRGRLLAALLTNLERWCDHWDDVASAYQDRCATVGRRVRLELPDGTSVIGRATAVEADGGLCVATEDGTFTFHAADVIHVTGP